jgi:photosystem II stability/assembly factor-like uncharacterized protein
MRVPDTIIRRHQALTIFGAAGLAILVAGAIYLRPSLTAPAIQRVPASSGVIAGSLDGVSFGDADHGAVEVIGFHGGIPETYFTADAGRSWTRMPAAIDAVISVQFFGPRRVMARTAGPSGDTLRLSEDGGHTWRLLATPRARLGPLYFLDSQNGWWLATEPFALTPHPSDTFLLKTSDGGSSWQRLRTTGIPPTGVGAVLTFVDPLHGTLLLISQQGSTSSMLTTSDGGDSWRAVDAPVGPIAGTPVLTSTLIRHGRRLLRSFLAIPEDVLGANRPVISLDTHSGFYATTYVAISDDGGQTWTQPRAGARLFGQFAPENPLLDDRGRLLLLRDRQLWVSDDDGATWAAHVIQAPADMTPQRLVAVAPRALFGIAIENAAFETRFPVRVQTLIRSTDGGAHWSPIALPSASLG